MPDEHRDPLDAPEHAALRRDVLAAFDRKAYGVHRALLGQDPARAIALACALARAAGAAAYAVRLEPWLRAGNTPFDALGPYTHVARFAGRPTLVLVCDGAALMDPAHRAWRGDPLGARLLRRTMLSSPAPTLWWTASLSDLPPEVATHCRPVSLAPGPACGCARSSAGDGLCAVALVPGAACERGSTLQGSA